MIDHSVPSSSQDHLRIRTHNVDHLVLLGAKNTDKILFLQFFMLLLTLLTCSSCLCIALTAKLEAANKALAEERAS
jgi:hypothetical protein